MSDEWIIQFGGVFVELVEKREQRIRKQKLGAKVLNSVYSIKIQTFIYN